MKIKEFANGLDIALSNEEAGLLENITQAKPLGGFTERERVIISHLVRKGCLSKVVHENIVMVVKNEC